MLDRNLAENISRVLYPNDNVSNELAIATEAAVSQHPLSIPVQPTLHIERFYLHAE